MPRSRFFVFVFLATIFCACEACKDAPTVSAGPPEPKWVYYTTSNSQLLNNYVTAIVLDGDGRMWLGTKSGASSRLLKNPQKYFLCRVESRV